MVYGFAVEAKQGDQISEMKLKKSIKRNFSGLDDLDPIRIFSYHFDELKSSVKVIRKLNVGQRHIWQRLIQ